jgi:glycosyltransferase involved in cell wall biosynthesis
VAFGHIGPNRRIDKILRAIAGVRSKRACHLHLIGDVWNERLLRDLAQELGIGTRLTCHGHLSDALLDDQLSLADLVVNLRYPTMGEASFSQLRSMKHAVPTLVSRAGWYSELPSDTVIHVTPGQEIAEVAEVLSALGAHAEEFRAIGERGRRLLVTDHAPAAYVEGALAFATEQAHSIRPIAEALASKIARDVLPLGRSGDLLVKAAADCGDFVTGFHRAW